MHVEGTGSIEVVLGPLPIRPMHFVAPALFLLISSCIGGLGLVAIATGPMDELSPFLCGAVFPLALVAMASYWIVLALRRRNACIVAVTQTTIVPPGGPPVPRAPNEAVTVMSVTRGMGQYPVWAIDYGNRDHAVRLCKWMSFSGPAELEPFARALRRALGQDA